MDSNKTNKEIIYIPSCWPADDQDINYDPSNADYYEITCINTSNSLDKELKNNE